MPKTGSTPPPRESLDGEVRSSWGFLFTTAKNRKKREEDYERLLLPYPNEDYCQVVKRHHLGMDSSCSGSDNQHLIYSRTVQAALQRNSILYTHFPIFETRLRQLRFYMDSQKPRGFRQLWKDNRDSLNYYTFWGVIVFGTLSVFLAFFSLAVSIVQTVVSFRALDLASPSQTG